MKKRRVFINFHWGSCLTAALLALRLLSNSVFLKTSFLPSPPQHCWSASGLRPETAPRPARNPREAPGGLGAGGTVGVAEDAARTWREMLQPQRYPQPLYLQKSLFFCTRSALSVG